MKRSKAVWVLGIVLILATVPALAGKWEFTVIEGGTFLVPQDMTADGSKMVLSGYFGAPYFTYTAEEGVVEIGGGGSGGNVSISDDGSTIGGSAVVDGVTQAALYLGDGQWEGLGSEPGAVPCGGSGISSGYAVNNHTLVGLAWRAQICKAIGGVWDLGSASFSYTLESGVPDRATRANDINDDGTISSGWSDNDFGTRRAARWVNGEFEILMDGEGNIFGEILASNNDGTAMVGASYQFTGDGRGWLYRNGEFLPMGQGAIGGANIQSVPINLSEDGSFVIGITRNFSMFTQYGWVWDAKKGWERFEDWLRGGRTAAGWTQMIPSAISADGSIIAGYGLDPDGQIAAWILDPEANRR